MADAPETPWALLQRLRAEGHAQSVIVERLKALGLDDGDVKVLMMDAPPAKSGMEMPDGAKIAAVLVAGPLLGGLMVAAMSEGTADREPPPPQVALDPADTSARCAVHVELASVGACPRCGGFVCRSCGGADLAGGCVRCRTSPRMRDERLRRAARRVAFASYGGVALLVGSAAFDHVTKDLTLLAIVGGVTAPLLVLATVQLQVRVPWPGVVAAVWSGPLFVAMVMSTDRMTMCGWLLVIAAQLATLISLFQVRKASS